MEVEIMLSSALEDIVSPHDLAVAIGIPHGAKLRLYRDTRGQRVVTKIVLNCDKPTASRLRHRFGTQSRTYVHHGQLASLKVVGMRPVITGHCVPANASLRQRVVALGSAARIEPAGFSSTATALTTSPSSSPGVEVALEMVDRDEAAACLLVPGISELCQEFQQSVSGTRDVKQHVGARRRRRCTHANEEKMSSTGRYYGERKLSDEDTTRSEECSGCSSSETKRGSSIESADSFVWDDGRRVEHVERQPGGQRRRSRQRRRHSRAWPEEGDRKPTAFIVQQRIAAYRRRWRQRQAMACTRSVADMASALVRISREYPDAPQPLGRTEIVSILAKMYADGAAFAGNGQRDLETLDRLGVVRWSARVHPQLLLPRETMGASEVGHRSKKAREGWLRILWRVLALVRKVADFGIFVQVYAAAMERDRFGESSAVVSVEGSCMRGGEKDRRPRGRTPSPYLGASDDDDDGDSSPKVRPGPSSAPGHSRCRPAQISVGRANKADTLIACSGRETALDAARKGADTCTGTEMETPTRHIEKPQSLCQLRWLFPVGPGNGGRRAFDRYVICGGGVHGLVTLEAAAAIVRDAGKYISAERVWRWFCDRSKENSLKAAGAKPGGASGRGHLLQFEDFVEMCDGLREHMEDVSIMSDDDTQRHV